MKRLSHKLIVTVGLFALSSGIASAQVLNPVITHTLNIVPTLGSSNALAFTRTGGNGNALGLVNGPVNTGVFHSQLGNLDNVGNGNLDGLLSSGDRGHRILNMQLVGDVGPIDVNVLNGVLPTP
jgi:hypothetical protein